MNHALTEGYAALSSEVLNGRVPPGWIKPAERLEEIRELLDRVKRIAWRNSLRHGRSQRRISLALQRCAQEYRLPTPAPTDALEWWQERLVRAWPSGLVAERILASAALVASFHPRDRTDHGGRSREGRP